VAEVQLFQCLEHNTRRWQPMAEERRGGSVQGGAEQRTSRAEIWNDNGATVRVRSVIFL
jgi:hypothetical protein